MTPHDFIAKWRSSELKERSDPQSHLNDLCALLDPKVAHWCEFDNQVTFDMQTTMISPRP